VPLRSVPCRATDRRGSSPPEVPRIGFSIACTAPGLSAPTSSASSPNRAPSASRLAPAMISTPGHRASRRRRSGALPAWSLFARRLPGWSSERASQEGPRVCRLAVEGDGFEPSVPLHILTVSGPPLVGSVTVPFAKTDITLSRPGTERSKPASAAECTRQSPGGFPLARYRRRRGSDLRPSAYGTSRARWCAPATITARVLRSRLQNHVEGRLRRAPDALEAARADNLAKPCLAGLRTERRTDLLRQRGRHADHRRTRIIKSADRVPSGSTPHNALTTDPPAQ
jgi:hypothetical protein